MKRVQNCGLAFVNSERAGFGHLARGARNNLVPAAVCSGVIDADVTSRVIAGPADQYIVAATARELVGAVAIILSHKAGHRHPGVIGDQKASAILTPRRERERIHLLCRNPIAPDSE
jgi:hypothetical protein